ncbi:hypothetical protein LWI29_011267 [Acer saccharum]|uniref:MULE transposase domain-containing protein n=1 Tax=Acer saccharum TaxID=4024 RepID=A0AA39SAC6_ACESA|nr:hypothetical protein LWI29_011267 [Acer saccharum]
MSKKAPKTIFTYQDAAMAKAISSVMPDTYHKLYTWHIMQNAFEKVNPLFRGPGGVDKVLSKFIDLEVDFESDNASIVYAALAVDKELQPDKVKRQMSIANGKLSVHFEAVEARFLRTSFSAFVDVLTLATKQSNSLVKEWNCDNLLLGSCRIIFRVNCYLNSLGSGTCRDVSLARSKSPVSNSDSAGGGIDLNLSGILNVEFCGMLKPLSLGMAPSSTRHFSN